MAATIPGDFDFDDGSRGGIAVWLPWLLAPAFLLLPIGGCGLAAAVRRPPPLAGQSWRPAAGPTAETVAAMAAVAPQPR